MVLSPTGMFNCNIVTIQVMDKSCICTEMMPYIAEEFQECDFVHHWIFSFDMIDDYEPDIFVYEIIERSIDDTLPEFARLID